ncbi:hypothetical protein ACJ41O_000158 [Fusarium nematophilum]
MAEKDAIAVGKAATSVEQDTKANGSSPTKERSSFSDYMRVFSFASPVDHALLSIGILAAIGSGVAFAMANVIIGGFISIMTEFTTSGSPPSNFMSEVSKYALYFVYIAIARFVCTYIFSSLLTYAALRITRNLRYQYLKVVLGQEVGFFDQGSGISEKLGHIFQAIATFVASFVIAFVGQWKLTLILTSIVPALILIVGVVGGLDAGIETKILKIYGQAGSFAETVLASIRTTKAFGLGPRMASEYSKIPSAVVRNCSVQGQHNLVVLAQDPFTWTQPQNVLFAVIMAASTLNYVAPHMVTFSRAATAAGELFELIDRESSINPFEDSGDTPLTTTGFIELDGVIFSYPTRPGIRVLDGYSLSVPAGKVTALVGASGSGKSTIIGLLERWYNPSAGTIKLDGKKIEELNLKWLRTNMRLVQQEPVLFNGTVFENISNGLVVTEWENSSSEQKLDLVQAAAKTAFAHDFIQELPEGYDTRIASKDRTTIVIAHKLKIIQNADDIVVMSQGKIVEQGRHADLVARQGAYAKLVKAQDLSTGNSDQISDDSSEEADDNIVLKPTNTLQKRQSKIDRHATMPKPEDYDLHDGTGIFRTAFRLVRSVPEIKLWIALVAITRVVGAGVFPGQTILLGRVMDVFKALNMKKKGNFLPLMFFVMAVGLIVVYGILGWATNVVAQTFAENIRNDMFASMLRQDLAFFDRPENTVGALTSRIDSYAQSIFELMGFTIAIISMALVSVFVCGILSIAFSWKLGLVGVCAGIPPMLLAGYGRMRLETKMDSDIGSKFSKSASIASETVTTIRTVPSLAIEDDVLRRYTTELDTAISGSKASLFTIMIWFSFTQSIGYFILALGFWYGSKLVAEGQLTFYQFFVSFLSVYLSGFAKANSAANYFFWIRSLEPTVRETKDNIESGPIDGCKSYNLQDIEFSYPLAPHQRIEPRQFVAFVGASGCGKSTIISMLERFYDPTNGTITIDETTPLPDLNPRLYRAHVSLVQQEPTLFPGSIRDNIAMAIDQEAKVTEDGPVDDKVIEAACRAANAWDFVSSLPDGLGTPCGTGGSQLSGGQIQRIAIARALVRNPNVILLDEATSALDTESERVVQAALMEAATSGNRITIAVAHRLSTVRDADCIFVFHGGRIVEAGSHAELIAKGGMYKKMCEAQSLDSAV